MKSKFFKVLLVISASFFVNCGNTSGTIDDLVQIQRVGRPVVSQELLLTTQSMHIYDSMTPFDDINGGAGTDQIFSEMQTVVQMITTFGATLYGTSQPGFQNFAAGFVPDVLRINTENNFTPSDNSNSEDTGFTHMAFNGDYGLVGGNSSQVIFTGGRKIEDGVMNITFAYLFSGLTAATTGFNPKAVNGTGPATGSVMGWSDELTYDMGSTCDEAQQVGGPLVPNGAGTNSYQSPGHYCLVGQANRYATANFPFLPVPSGSY
jgi:hypothetical protein